MTTTYDRMRAASDELDACASLLRERGSHHPSAYCDTNEMARELRADADRLEAVEREIASKDAEIERLREQLRLANIDACVAEAEANEYREVGPTPLRGRITARNRTDDEGRN